MSLAARRVMGLLLLSGPLHESVICTAPIVEPPAGHVPSIIPHACILLSQAGGDRRARRGHGPDQHPQLPAPRAGPEPLQILLRDLRRWARCPGPGRLGGLARLGAHQPQLHRLRGQRRHQAVGHVGRVQRVRQPVRTVLRHIADPTQGRSSIVSSRRLLATDVSLLSGTSCVAGIHGARCFQDRPASGTVYVRPEARRRMRLLLLSVSKSRWPAGQASPRAYTLLWVACYRVLCQCRGLNNACFRKPVLPAGRTRTRTWTPAAHQ